jgi:hypothetical protein
LPVLLLVSCSQGLFTAPIGKLLTNPRDYEAKSVTIAGKVTNRNSLLVLKYFTVRDASGEIPVVTKRILPEVGSEVRVKGRITQLSLLDKEIVVLTEDAPRVSPMKPRVGANLDGTEMR